MGSGICYFASLCAAAVGGYGGGLWWGETGRVRRDDNEMIISCNIHVLSNSSRESSCTGIFRSN